MEEPIPEKVPLDSRSRSSTATSNKSRKRTQSQASTTSLHEQLAVEPPNKYHRTWYEQGHVEAQRERFSVTHQMTPEDMLMHSATQLQNPQPYGLDPTLNANHGLPYEQDNNKYAYKSDVPSHVEHYDTSFGERDGHMVDGHTEEKEDVDSATLAGDLPKKASKSSAANELEMRQLFNANKHRTLPDVAQELHGNERGPLSERQRQVFAMLWINQVCDKGKGSVPRGRVYSNYVSRCATERVTVLNPASFGVRGESKYHYVNFSLQEDQPEMVEPQNHRPLQSFHEPQPSFTQSFATSHTIAPIAQFAPDRATFPSPMIPMPEPVVNRSDGFARPHSLYNQPEILDVDQLESTSTKIAQQLRFLPQTESASGNTPIDLPKIDSFLPAGTDLDAAKALSALYRSHCISLVDSIRFCKEKTFFHLYTAFHGTLTMPVQKLFAHSAIARWIKECDFVMYQKMVVVLSALTLQVVPKQILDTLRNISARLVPHIQNTFQTLPAHVVAAKVGPATLFAGLLDRKLRVNLTAHAAANMLCNPANRDQMYHDFITEVRTRKVAECVPTRGMDDVVNLLLTEMRHLLDPVNVSWEIESRTPYGQMAARTGQQQQADIHADTSTENVLDRWVNFLTSLPANFPYATHAEIVWCVQAVGTAVMRDLTIAQCKSFGAWWVTKCWIDEMIAFTAEEGGFMEYKSSPEISHEAPSQPFLGRTTSNRESRYSSASDDFLRDSGHGDGISIPRPMDITSQAAMNAAAGHDDSGIGMRTPEDDYGKYDYTRDEVASHLNHHMIQETGV